jgi:hypothetical protein
MPTIKVLNLLFTFRLPWLISHHIIVAPFRGGSRHLHKGDLLFFWWGGGLEKKSIPKQFALRKIKRYPGIVQREITKQGKKKNDKDEIGNLLLRRFFQSISLKRGAGPPGLPSPFWIRLCLF